MGSMKFTATKLSGTGKLGSLKPDADGYYTVVLGGLNTLNSGGQYYDLQGAEHLFLNSSAFMRRVQKGCLKIEVTHPKPEPGMSEDAYIARLMDIDLKNVCGHISEVWLDENFGRNHPELKNPNLVAILGKVKPSGDKAATLQLALDNAKENVCFSIRSFTRNYQVGRTEHRVLDVVVTFDLVNEGGILAASKWDSPTLETITEKRITERQMDRFLNAGAHYATEDSKAIALEVINNIRESSKAVSSPLYEVWH